MTDPENYRTLWENEFVRVLEYQDEPGTATSSHRHPNSVMVTLSDFTRRLASGDRVLETSLTSGTAAWLPAQWHSGENIGATPTHVILVELKGASAGEAAASPLGPDV